MTNQTAWPEFQPAETTTPKAPRAYKYYDLLMVAFVTVLICSEFHRGRKGRPDRCHSNLARALCSSRCPTCLATSSRRFTAMPDRGK